MKAIRVAYRSVNHGVFSRRLNRSISSSPMTDDNSYYGIILASVDPGNNDNQNAKPVGSDDDYINRFFELSGDKTAFPRAFDNVTNDRYGPILGFGDGMDEELRKAATYFEVDPQETAQDNYTYRPDVNMRPKMTYTPEDLNMRKPGVWKPSKRSEFEVTTKEVLEQADFRNVKFLAKFLTEAGIIIKRSQTGISAKAQRKIAREIKTARNFGLLPFTTMGTKSFVYGKTMENLDHDFELDPYDIHARADDVPDPVEE